MLRRLLCLVHIIHLDQVKYFEVYTSGGIVVTKVQERQLSLEAAIVEELFFSIPVRNTSINILI